MSYEIETAAISVLEAIDIAAAEAEFDESKVKRAKDGKFAKKEGAGSTEIAEPTASDLKLIDRVKEIFPAGGDLLQSIADRGKDPAIDGAVKQVLSAYDKATKAPASAISAIGSSCLAAQKSIDKIKDYALTEKDFHDENNPKAIKRQTELVRDLKKNIGRAAAAISALLDPSQLAQKMAEAEKWLKTKANNTLEGASVFLNGLLKSANDNISKPSPQKSIPTTTPVTSPAKPADPMDNGPARLAKSQVRSAVEFSETVGKSFEAAANSEFALKSAELAQKELQALTKATSNTIDLGMKKLSEIDYKANLEVAGKAIKETTTKTIADVSTLADEFIVAQDFGQANTAKLQEPSVVSGKTTPSGIDTDPAPKTLDRAKSELVDYSGRVGRAIYGVLTAKVAETVGKLPQNILEKDDKPDIRPPAATGLDRLKKKLGLQYNSPKARTPLGQLGRNIENSLRERGQEITESIRQYGKDVERNKPLIRQDLGIPSVRDLILTDDTRAILDFKDRAEQLLKGVGKTAEDRANEIDREQDLRVLALEGMRRMQNLQQLMNESIRQSALDYQAAAEQRLAAKQAALQTTEQ